MTVDGALAALRELRALERVVVRIDALETPAPEWTYALATLRAQVQFIRVVLAREAPALLAHAEARYRAELAMSVSHVVNASQQPEDYLDSHRPEKGVSATPFVSRAIH